MKRFAVFFFLATILSVAQSSVVYAQKVSKPQQAHRPLPDDGDGTPPPPLAPGQLFVGEWEWADGGEVFRLTITRNPAYIFPEYPNDPPVNVIICHFVYTRNGVVVDHSLSTGRMPYAALGSPANNHAIEMVFYEHGTKGFGYLTLSFSANNPDVLNWSLLPRETHYRNPADRPAVPFLVPTAMTLTRQL